MSRASPYTSHYQERVQAEDKRYGPPRAGERCGILLMMGGYVCEEPSFGEYGVSG